MLTNFVLWRNIVIDRNGQSIMIHGSYVHEYRVMCLLYKNVLFCIWIFMKAWTPRECSKSRESDISSVLTIAAELFCY